MPERISENNSQARGDFWDKEIASRFCRSKWKSELCFEHFAGIPNQEDSVNSLNSTAKPRRAIGISQDTTQFFVGPLPRGPKRCIKCAKEFKNGEAWKRMTAPKIAEFGTYSIGIHIDCECK